MMARAHIALFSQDDELQSRREGARARALLLQAGLPVLRHENSSDMSGEFQSVLEAAQMVRDLVHQRGMGRLTTLVKLGAAVPVQPSEKRASG